VTRRSGSRRRVRSIKHLRPPPHAGVGAGAGAGEEETSAVAMLNVDDDDMLPLSYIM